MTPTWNVKSTTPDGYVTHLHVPDIWAVVEACDKRFCAPMTAEDEKRFKRALEIGREGRK